jgi:hypothetical protein
MSLLADIAPDVLDEALNTFTNPIQGLGNVFQKIAACMKAERDNPA